MRPIEVHVDPDPDCLGPLDRGLHYGDGLFETMRVVAGRVPFLPWHAERLRRGCERLELPYPGDFERQAGRLAARHPEAVLKFLYTAGPARRGYARPPDGIHGCSGWTVHPVPEEVAEGTGLHVRWCTHRLATQPALAGVKHLNRLDQVLARAEWSDPGIAEGLLCDQEGHPVEGIQSNLFWVHDGRLHTPVLDRCGVAGVMRRAVLAWAAQAGIPVMEGRFHPEDVMRAEELFLCNSIRGIQAVTVLADRSWAPGALARHFEQRLQRIWQGLEALPE